MSEVLDQKPADTNIRKIDMPIVFLQCAIFLADNKVLGNETFRLVSMKGQESISEPFEFELELHGNTDALGDTPLQFSDVIGCPVTVGVNLPFSVPAEQAEDIYQKYFLKALKTSSARDLDAYADKLSLFNGIASAFSMEIPGVYKMTVKPALWRLTLTNRYCIHRQKNIRDAIAEVLKSKGIKYSMDAIPDDDELAGARVQDWLQAGETDYEFIHRLMTKAHLYYYYAMCSGKDHKVIFGNRAAYPNVFEDGRTLRYTYTSADEAGLEQNDVISQYNYKQSLTSSGVRTVFARQEAAWEKDTVARYETYGAPDNPDVGKLALNVYKIYQYGCSTREVEYYTAQTTDALAATRTQFSGASFCAHFRSGYQFKVSGLAEIGKMVPMPIQPALEKHTFVLTQVQHEATLDGGYRNQFQATDAAGLITPFSVQDTQQGLMMARVVAHDAEDTAPSDWKYYKKNNFDPQESEVKPPPPPKVKGVYVEFSISESGGSTPSDAVWVKLAPHMTSVPEIGVTVMVARSGDESELPEIQSIVQANGTYTVTPSKWTANTHVGSSYSTSYGDGKSIRFGEKSAVDLDAAINIVNAAYDTKQYREASYSKGASYSYSTSESGEAGILSRSESYGSTYSEHHGAGSWSKSVLGKSESYTTIKHTSYSENTHNGKVTSITTIDADSVTQSTQTGNTTSTMSLTGNATNTNTNNGNVTSTSTVTGTSDNTATYDGKVTTTTTHNAPVESTTDHYGDVTSTTTHHSGANVDSTTTIDGDSTNTSKITGTSTSHTNHHIVHNFSSVAAQSSSSAIGASNSNDAIGVSNSNSAIGLSNKNTAMGASLDINAILSSTTVNLIANSNNVDLIGPGFHFTNRGEQPNIEIKNFKLSMIDGMEIFF